MYALDNNVIMMKSYILTRLLDIVRMELETTLHLWLGQYTFAGAGQFARMTQEQKWSIVEEPLGLIK